MKKLSKFFGENLGGAVSPQALQQQLPQFVGSSGLPPKPRRSVPVSVCGTGRRSVDAQFGRNVRVTQF